MHQFHNPENLTAEQIGAKDGWRLLLGQEMESPQNNLQMLGCDKQWHDSELNGSKCCPAPCVTYRTRAPLPATFCEQAAANLEARENKRSCASHEDCDEAAFHNYWTVCQTKLRDTGKIQREAFLGGITYERTSLRALVAQYNSGDLKSHEFIHAVSERCK